MINLIHDRRTTRRRKARRKASAPKKEPLPKAIAEVHQAPKFVPSKQPPEELSKKKIMRRLSFLGIEYDAKAKKSELIKLLKEAHDTSG